MSANDGIYVLYTESEKGPEYRVKYASAIDNIYGEWDESSSHWKGDINSIRDTFGEAPVFYTLNEALDHAEDIAYDYDSLEDGICVINDFSNCGHAFV